MIVVEKRLLLAHQSECVVIQQHHLDVDTLFCSGGQFLDIHQHAAITAETHHTMPWLRQRCANGGRQAVEMISRMGKDIDMVILDLIMPGMDGGKTFDRIRKVQPATPVLLSSGYAINDQVTLIMNKGCKGFIQKPFNLSELSLKVRQILDGAEKPINQ